MQVPDRQRIDRWLWHARIARTRTLAAGLAVSGHVRLNGRRVDAAAQPVRSGDILTVALPSRVRVLNIVGFAPRRGNASQARALYDDLSPPPPPKEPDAPSRPRGSGRPTKRDRRALDRLRG
jgi:ribosome-associated heat shock protein Hsp15